MNNKLKLLAVAFGMAFGAAQAGTITLGGIPAGANGQTSAIGTCTVDFNSGNATNTCGATYTGTASGNFVSGSLSGKYAAPVGDTSTYLTVGPSSGSQAVTISLANQANYFGFYTGSLDTYNLVQFYLKGALIDSFTGNQVPVAAFISGNQNQAEYINYFPTAGTNQAFFDKVIYSSSRDAFETDNHSFGVAAIPVPEPGSLALIGLAGLALLSARRRKQS